MRFGRVGVADDQVTTRIYRVSVRGRFADLDDATRQRLLDEIDEHDIVHAEFTEAGTLTYDRSLVTFTFRYQLLESGEDTELKVMAEARARTIIALASKGLGYRDLQIRAMDMAELWR